MHAGRVVHASRVVRAGSAVRCVRCACGVASTSAGVRYGASVVVHSDMQCMQISVQSLQCNGGMIGHHGSPRARATVRRCVF